MEQHIGGNASESPAFFTNISFVSPDAYAFTDPAEVPSRTGNGSPTSHRHSSQQRYVGLPAHALQISLSFRAKLGALNQCDVAQAAEEDDVVETKTGCGHSLFTVEELLENRKHFFVQVAEARLIAQVMLVESTLLRRIVTVPHILAHPDVGCRILQGMPLHKVVSCAPQGQVGQGRVHEARVHQVSNGGPVLGIELSQVRAPSCRQEPWGAPPYCWLVTVSRD